MHCALPNSGSHGAEVASLVHYHYKYLLDIISLYNVSTLYKLSIRRDPFYEIESGKL